MAIRSYVVLIGILLAVPSAGLAVCGSDPGDAAAVAALESAAAAQCDCCSLPRRGQRLPCVLRLVKRGIRSRGLPARCAAKVLRDAARACPLAADVPCRLCRTDADCQATQFCECATGTCGQSGGVCVTKPAVCPDIVAPVCGCDGTTFANDCLRQAAGACKRRDGRCAETGGCFDRATGSCTGEACGPERPCPAASEFCNPDCGTPPPTGTCFDLLTRKCSSRGCSPAKPCLPNEACVTVCPPPPPSGRCFVTVELHCSDEPCDAEHPCRNPNEFCSPLCLASTTTTTVTTATTTTTEPGEPCASDADCDDGNFCSVDRCVGGACEHACICAGPTGAPSCCPGPAALCVRPTTTTMPTTCIPFFQFGCAETADCCEPCGGRVPPCAVCIQGQCVGAP